MMSRAIFDFAPTSSNIEISLIMSKFDPKRRRRRRERNNILNRKEKINKNAGARNRTEINPATREYSAIKIRQLWIFFRDFVLPMDYAITIRSFIYTNMLYIASTGL